MSPFRNHRALVAILASVAMPALVMSFHRPLCPIPMSPFATLGIGRSSNLVTFTPVFIPSNTNAHHSLYAAASSSDDDDDDDDEEAVSEGNSVPQTEIERRHAQYVKYNGLQLAWIIDALLKLTPGAILYQKKQLGLNMAGIASYSVGLLVAAGVAKILAMATFHDRLGSDTYKRLNLLLMGFCVINLTSFTYFTTPALAGLGVFVAWDGFVNGIRGFQPNADSIPGIGDALKEWREGIVETIEGLFKARNFVAFVYLLTTWLIGVANVTHAIPILGRYIKVSERVSTCFRWSHSNQVLRQLTLITCSRSITSSSLV